MTMNSPSDDRYTRFPFAPLSSSLRTPEQMERAAPEDALVIAEVLLRIKNAVGDMPRRADGCVNAHDLWLALDEAFTTAEKEAHEG